MKVQQASITFHNISPQELYRASLLFARLVLGQSLLDITVEVEGSFRDLRGDLIFKNGLHPVDVVLFAREEGGIVIQIDTLWQHVKPVADNLHAARLTYKS